MLVWSVQSPAPLQIFPVTLPFTQVVGPQLFPLAPSAHCPGVPEHEFCSPQGSVESTHWLPGFVPTLAAPQVPALAGFPSCLLPAEQAMHLPVHAVSQQTLSAQWVEVHWLSPEQTEPLDFLGWQALPSQ